MYEVFDILSFLAIIGFVVGLVWIIYNAIKKKSYRKSIIVTVSSILVFIVTIVLQDVYTSYVFSSVDDQTTHSSSNNTHKNRKVKELKLGETQVIKGHNSEVEVTLTDVKKIDSSNKYVQYIAQENEKLQEFAVCSYKVKVLKGSVNSYDFDAGYNLKILDAKKETADVSGDRWIEIPEKINEGETVNYECGVGFYNKTDKVYLRLGDYLWSANV